MQVRFSGTLVPTRDLMRYTDEAHVADVRKAAQTPDVLEGIRALPRAMTLSYDYLLPQDGYAIFAGEDRPSGVANCDKIDVSMGSNAIDAFSDTFYREGTLHRDLLNPQHQTQPARYGFRMEYTESIEDFIRRVTRLADESLKTFQKKTERRQELLSPMAGGKISVSDNLLYPSYDEKAEAHVVAFREAVEAEEVQEALSKLPSGLTLKFVAPHSLGVDRDVLLAEAPGGYWSATQRKAEVKKTPSGWRGLKRQYASKLEYKETLAELIVRAANDQAEKYASWKEKTDRQNALLKPID